MHFAEDGDEDETPDRRSTERKKRKREERKSFKATSKLLSYASEGKARKIQKLLKSEPALNVDAFNFEGRTALHQAAKYGNTAAVSTLLRNGADSRAEDFLGNTAAHLAAAEQQLTTLAELLQAESAPSLDARNADGISIREMMQAAMEKRVRGSAPRQAQEQSAHSGSVDDSEDAWEQKLRVNAEFDDFESTAADWDSFEYSSFPGGGAEVDEETYARKMWESMNARRRSTQGPSAATADTWARFDDARDRRQKAAESAAAASRKILEEEQAKDRAWRQAVLQGDLGARRATYEAKWHVFAHAKGPAGFDSVPWLVNDTEDARAVVLYGTNDPTEERKRIRTELMRWHPDKFFAKFSSRMSAQDQPRILERVKHISQMLNSLSATS